MVSGNGVLVSSTWIILGSTELGKILVTDVGDCTPFAHCIIQSIPVTFVVGAVVDLANADFAAADWGGVTTENDVASGGGGGGNEAVAASRLLVMSTIG